MDHLKNLKQKRSDLRARFKKLSNLLAGSLVVNKRTCGNPNCKCARGEKHKTLELSKKVDGVTKNIYIPWSSEKQARKMAENYQELRTLLKEITEVNLEILRFGINSRTGRKK